MAEKNAKRERIEAEKAAERKEMAKYRTVGIVTVVCIVLALLVIILYNTNFIYNALPALSVNGKNYTVDEFNIAYVSEYNMYYQQVVNYVGEDYASQFMPSNYESFKTQVYSESTGDTWFELFKNRAIETLRSYTAIEAEAKKAGFTLSEEGAANVEEEMATLDNYIEIYKSTYNTDYLEYMYGVGTTRDMVKKFVELQALCTEYYSKVSSEKTYTEAELDAAYAEVADTYDFITYETYVVNAEITPAGETATQEEIDAAMDTARTEAEAKKADFTDGTSTTVEGASVSSVFAEWLLSADRKSGDIEIFEFGGTTEATSNGYYVVKFVERDDNHYIAKNIYYISIADLDVDEDSFEKDADGNIIDTEGYEAAKAAAHEGAKVRAEEMLAAWNEGTYATAADLVTAFTEYVAGANEITDISKHSISDEVDEWLYDNSRVVNDAQYFDVSDMYYIFVYEGDGNNYAYSLVESTLRSEDMDAWNEALIEAYPATEQWAMRFVGDVYMEKIAANS